MRYHCRDIPFLVSNSAIHFPDYQNQRSVLITHRLDAGPHVIGKKHSVYKSFTAESEAYLWIQVALLKGNIELIN